jgi:hypothetical protein
MCAVFLLMVVAFGLALNNAEVLQRERAQHRLDVRPNVAGAFSARWEYLDGNPTTTVVGVLYQNGAVEYFRVSWPEEGVDAKASH